MKSPMIPMLSMPPMAPSRITDVGTDTPRPRKMAFSGMSAAAAKTQKIANAMAGSVLMFAKPQTRGSAIGTITGNWTIANTRITMVRRPAPGNPTKRRPAPQNAA